MFSANSSKNLAKEISDYLGLNECKDLRKYLGFPLNSNLNRTENYQELLNKIDNKLAGGNAIY